MRGGEVVSGVSLIDSSGALGFPADRPPLGAIKGDPFEIDILQHEVGIGKVPIALAAPRFRELLAQNPEWEALFEHFGDSSKHLTRLLVELYPDRFRAYGHLYRMTKALNLGEGPHHPRVILFPKPSAMPECASPRQEINIQDIITDFETEKHFTGFVHNRESMLARLRELIDSESNSVLRASYQQALDHFLDIIHLSIPAFREEYQPRPYQAEAILKGLHRGIEETSMADFDGPRSGKTLVALGRFEHLRRLGVAKKAVIIAPADVKGQWQERMNEYYIDLPKSVFIEGNAKEKQLALAALPDTAFTIASYDLLVSRKNRSGQAQETDEKVSRWVEELGSLGADCLIVDEGHYAKNVQLGTKRAEAILRLAKASGFKHLIWLTATPADRVKDMNIVAHLLDPETYPTVVSFSTMHQDNPRLGHNDLMTKVVRRTAKETLGLPDDEENIVPIQLTPTQQAVYEHIHQQEDSHQFRKLTNLRAALLQPGLVGSDTLPFDKQTAYALITGAYLRWRQQVARNPDLSFDSDFLVTNGYKELYLSALFNLNGGITEFIQELHSPLIAEAWHGETVPAKFVKIKELIEECIKKGEKVVVFSSIFAKGVTDDVGREHFQSLLQYLQQEFGEETILKIDGSNHTEARVVLPDGSRVSERELIRRQWKDDPTKRILLTTIGSSSLGIDLSIQDPTIPSVSVIFEGLPYSYSAYEQSVARVHWYGQTAPTRVYIVEAENALDEEIYQLLREKKQLIDMLLDAVPLTDEEIKFLEESPDKVSSILSRMIHSPRQNMAWMFQYMQGKPADVNRQFLAGKFTKSQTCEEYLAEWYDELYEHGYPKYVADVVKAVIEGLESRYGVAERLADLACGTLGVARALGRPVISLDINESMLREGKKKLVDQDIAIPDEWLVAGSITELPKDVFPDESIDIGVCSLALDCTAPGEEREQAVKEMRRSLKPGGHLILTLPEGVLTSEDFAQFRQELEAIGFQDNLGLSGYVRGHTGNATVFHTWLFVLQKIDSQEYSVDSQKLLFAFEKQQGGKKRSKERQLQKRARDRAQKMPTVERLIVCVPEARQTSNHWVEKGELHELVGNSLRRELMDLSEDELATYGFERDIYVRGGKQGIRLTRQ
ncbi:MAG: methyltransferase domain-containing protein [Candidatus Levybacteria bacterium]|nr:methyltransferase domain-containing protein [Candidatus Levybacteria bacterium]